MNTYYYDVHVFYSRNDGFSKPIKIETDKIFTDDDVIQYAVDNGHIGSEDVKHVDYVTEIDEEEYNEMILTL